MKKNPVSILILAAGKGVRMRSVKPKVLHTLGGQPMIERVLKTAYRLKPNSVAMVVGHQAEAVKAHVQSRYPEVNFFFQKKQDGSGGAVRSALSWVKKQRGVVLVTCGDSPLLQESTLRELLKSHRGFGNRVTVLSTLLSNPFGYGRIVRGSGEEVLRIVEELDASQDERNIREINSGTYAFDAASLKYAIPRLKNNNQKKEYYLTDVLEMTRNSGGRIGGVICENSEEALGVNSRRDLAKAEKALRLRKLEELMKAGVTLIDPSSTFVDESVQVGSDTVLWPQTFLCGKTRIGTGCEIGPWAHITDCDIKNDVIFKASYAESSIIRQGAKVGPFSRVRPNSDLGPKVHLGNFSEVKKSKLGEGSKVNHLSYLGDAIIGKNVNIGAGTITCNYDGINKSPTHIQDQAFIGSNVNLIAPVKIGAHAVIGAGSSISDDIPAWALAVERVKPIVKKNWAKRKFANLKRKSS
jgi:bifunctional UDP-N-acetylglucosamine pyrophosphorylase / glucosamine-1-phosphate N-acetyltransferase